MKDSTAYDTTGDGKLNAFVSRTTTGSLEDWKIASGGRADRTRLATGRSTRTSRACRLRRCMRGRRRSRVSSARRSSRYGTQPAPCFVRSLDPITTSRPAPACFVRWSLHPISPPQQQLPEPRGVVVGLMGDCAGPEPSEGAAVEDARRAQREDPRQETNGRAPLQVRDERHPPTADGVAAGAAGGAAVPSDGCQRPVRVGAPAPRARGPPCAPPNPDPIPRSALFLAVSPLLSDEAPGSGAVHAERVYVAQAWMHHALVERFEMVRRKQF